MNKISKFLFSPVLMGVLLVVLCVALATATFIENDFGSEVAKQKVYNSKWLEAILILLAVNLTGRIFDKKLYKPKKFTIFLFHIAFIVMILGAAITRYFGYEGTMHIREGEKSSSIVTAQRVLKVQFDGNDKTEFVLNRALERSKSFKESLDFEGKTLSIEMTKNLPNAYKKAAPINNGVPIVGFILSGKDQRGFVYMAHDEEKRLGMLNIAFNDNEDADVVFSYKGDSVYISSKAPVFVSVMGNQEEAFVTNERVVFEPKKLYKIMDYNFVLQEFYPSAGYVAQVAEVSGHSHGMKALTFSLRYGTELGEVTLWEDEWNNSYATGKIGNREVGFYYGNQIVELPFSLYLKDFVIDRYPGSMSPSSFSSYVTLNEAGEEPVDFHIYMNNILKHHGFRFYQSSYDQDEKGTILSVNSDSMGTGVTYFSYFLLIVGMVLSLINKNSFFRKTTVKDKLLVALVLFGISGLPAFSNVHDGEMPASHNAIDKKHAQSFGELLIQNPKGRTEPVFTFSAELLRKISRKETMLGLSPVQLFMEMNINPAHWSKAPIIRISNKELQEMLGITSNYAAYADFITHQQGYILQQSVQAAFAKPPAQRSRLDKAIIKTDEKINICYGIYSGLYLKILPVPEGSDSTMWYNAFEASKHAQNQQDSLFLSNIITFYFNEVNQARETSDYTAANEYLEGIKKFQRSHAGYDLPPLFKTRVEILYQKFNLFKKLFPFYSTMGLLYLFLLIFFIVRTKEVPHFFKAGFYYVIFFFFIFHTLAIIARWYISGHAPMSNGYESMIFISWVTLLAGFVFNKLSPFALPATVVLGGLTLMVANLSFMDPEITNLVPVLQSYWLTIHVSVITASYGFLGLGTVLGLINLILILFRTSKNQSRIVSTLESLTVINHKSLILGLYLLTIGTFLGAIWANESWGRYWGWDPKETWALISILVYTIVTHARLIPGMKGIFTFNILTIYAFGSILMTYFGVNYYLSGLHSYAGGDPVPIPLFVYYTVAAIILLTVGASYQFDKFSVKNKGK